MTDPLIERAVAGDERACSRLVEQHGAALRRYLDRRMGQQLRRAASASDLSQEVFLRVFRALGELPDDATQRTFRRWLFRNADWVLGTRGARARRHAGESAAGAAHEPVAPRASVGEVTGRDEVRWLQLLLARLKPDQAEIVRLRLQGLPFATVAAQAGVSEANARQVYARVLRRLREQRGRDDR